MDYSKYYTPTSIAQVLVKHLRVSPPEKIVDICCGSCNLLYAAQKRWKNAALYGTDIIERNDVGVIFEKIDGREYALKHPNEFPLVVANPPFDSLQKKGEYPQLFQTPFDQLSSSRLEIEMLLANLLMLKKGGVLLIIMPSSFVEGQTYTSIRKIIAKQYHVKSIIELDEDTFGATHIHSYALVIENKVCKSYEASLLSAKKENGEFTLVAKGKCTKRCLIKGVWNGIDICTNDLCLDIKRGSISSSCFIENGMPVLHTAKVDDTWQPSVRHINNTISPSVYAEPGDIIVSRIGKSAGQWCIYRGKKIPISDCLFRIKDPEGKVFAKIQGKKYNLKLRGVATQYITMSDLSYWVNSQS